MLAPCWLVATCGMGAEVHTDRLGRVRSIGGGGSFSGAER
uniref:Uncharacterized protein n=1 Tax=Arundo donax TaxID=35708 RepID=A0A0A9A701_ARUDO